MLSTLKSLSWPLRLKMVEVLDAWRIRGVPPQKLIDVPYFSQFESCELIEQFLSGDVKLADDPKWHNSGAVTPEEYASWAWHTCGMTCLKMALAVSTGKEWPIVELAKECEKYGGYVRHDGEIDQKGLRYKPFCEFVGMKFNWQAKAAAPLTVNGIIRAFANGKFVIVSIPPSVVRTGSTKSHRGGHLVLITGYDKMNRTLTYHDPGGQKDHGPSVTVDFTDFEKIFAHRGIIFGPKGRVMLEP